jgi:cholesterol transport system auxiliary component
MTALTGQVGLIVLLIALSALAGCGGSQPIQDRFYRLDPPPLVQPVAPPAPSILLVNNLTARGFLGGRQIIYRTTDEPLLTKRYDALLWDEPPANALTRALVNALRASKVFRFVVIPGEQSLADYRLSGELQRLEHLPTAQPPRVAATLHLTLVPTNDNTVMASRTYSDEEIIEGSTPDAMVEALTRLSARLIAMAVTDLQTRRSQLTSTASP